MYFSAMLALTRVGPSCCDVWEDQMKLRIWILGVMRLNPFRAQAVKCNCLLQTSLTFALLLEIHQANSTCQCSTRARPVGIVV
jgi:hypothetical protein